MNRVVITEIEGVRCKLGEGLHWDSSRNLLWFVDISSHKIYWYSPLNGKYGLRQLNSMVGWVIPVTGSSTILAGMHEGIARFDPFEEDSILRYLITDQLYPPSLELRLNDAKVDRFGRIWCGCVSILDESQPVASLARIDPLQGRVLFVDDGYMVANGPAISPDASFMLHSDSVRRITYRLELDPLSGDVLSKSVWRTYSAEEGSPDGMNFDEDGNVWIAFWGGGRVAQFSLDGTQLREIRIPALLVTNVCFGGSDLQDMFVTTAALDPGRGNVGAIRDRGGALFRIHCAGVRGAPAFEAVL